MKSIVISQADFEAIKSAQFVFSVEESNREFKYYTECCGRDEDGEPEYQPFFTSWVAGHVKAKCGELEINFPWVANGGNKTYKDAFDFEITFDCDMSDDIEANFSIVDECGDELEDIRDVLMEKMDYEWVSTVETMLPKDADENLDFDDDTEITDEMRKYRIARDDGASFKFTGVLVGQVTSPVETFRWSELSLYKTKGGRFVCSEVGYTSWQGERDHHRATVCDDETGVIDFFGDNWLAKELYASAGIDDTEEDE